MKSYLQLSVQYLKYEKRKTLITAFSIISAVILMSIIFILTFSAENNKIKQIQEVNGAYDVEFKGVNKSQASILKKHIKVEQAGIENKLIMSVISEQLIFADIGYYDDEAKKMLNAQLIEGRLPVNDNEIVLEEWILSQLGLSKALNQLVGLNIPNNSNILRESNKPIEKSTIYFKLVGILKNRTQDKSTISTIGLVAPNIATSFNLKSNNIDVYVKIKDGLSIYKSIYEIKDDLGIKDEQVIYNNKFIKEHSNKKSISLIELFLNLIVMTVCTGIIYNVLNMYILSRYREFGTLRAIGTTPRQLRNIILLQVVIISIICIPIGIVLGIVSVELLVNTIIYFQKVIEFVIIDINLILGVVLKSFLCILIASIISIFTLTRESISDTVRANFQSFNKEKSISSKHNIIILKFFSVYGKISYQNIWRNKKRSLITISLMSVAIVLFIVTSSFIYNFNPSEAVKISNIADYTMKSFQNFGYSTNDYSEIASLAGVEHIYKTQRHTIYVYAQKEEEYNYDNNKLERDDNGDYVKRFIQTNLYGYDEDALLLAKKNLQKGNINIEEMESSPVVLVVEDYYSLKNDLRVGDYITLFIGDPYENKDSIRKRVCKIGGFISICPIKTTNEVEGPTFIIHENIYNKFDVSSGYSQFNIKVNKNVNRETLESNLKNIADNVPKGVVISYTDEVNRYKEYKQQMGILFYSLVVVVIIIGIFNIMNTINISLSLRIKEFATLRILGMTKLQLRKAIIIEGALYGIISSILGSILGFIVIKLLLKFSFIQVSRINWIVFILTILIISIGCILMSILSVMIPLRNFAKINIVDTIRD